MRMLFLVILILSFCFFQEKEEAYPELEEITNPLIKKEVLKKMDEVKNQKAKECKKENLELAEMHVDSLVAVLLDPAKTNQKDIPPRPSRPSYNKQDSQVLEKVNIEPLFESVDEGK